MISNYLKVKHKNCLLELLQKYEKMFDGTLGKYTLYKKMTRKCQALSH